MNALSDNMESLVAVNAKPKARPQNQQGGGNDFARFGNRCLHCASQGHRAADCGVKKALMAKDGGKLPSNYKSAFDK